MTIGEALYHLMNECGAAKDMAEAYVSDVIAFSELGDEPFTDWLYTELTDDYNHWYTTEYLDDSELSSAY